MLRLHLLVFGCALFAVSWARAEVVRMEITHRGDLGESGYEEIVGQLHFEIDPALPGNAVIADVDLAPVNAAGRVRFSSDVRILKPKDPARVTGAAWMEIPNRGGRAALSPWITKNGFVVVSVGWEFDLPKQADRLRINVPAARNRDGSAIRGVVSATFTMDRLIDQVTVTDLQDYPPIDPAGGGSRLVKRARGGYPEGAEVPRSAWTLEGNTVRLQGGFEPGATYEVFYLAESPPVAGLGYAAIRDTAAWLRSKASAVGKVDRVYAFGSSQCGRLLRDFVYLGFNTDEKDRAVFDGIISHVAGAGRLVLNQRWSTPRSTAAFHTASFPFTDKAEFDPVSGQTEGLLENPRVKHPPRIFYLNSSAEYWGAGRVAALTHTDPTGTRDVAFPAGVRNYFFAGTQHGSAPFPPTALVKDAPLANPVNASRVVVALRLAMHRWVTEGVEPPKSRYPKLSDGTLVPVSQVRFPLVPGMGLPQGLTAGRRLPNHRFPGGAGEGVEMPLLVPQVDADGNELAGIRLPDVAVPIATATGWVFRPAVHGWPHELVFLRGAWISFAATRAQRDRTSDSRLSLEERYESKEVYLEKVAGVLRGLVQDGLLDKDDVSAQLKQSNDRWDWIHRE